MTTSRYPLRKPASPRPLQSRWRRYTQDARRPLTSLLFLFPLAAIYELGTLLLPPGSPSAAKLVAHSLLQKILGWLGASGSWLPAAALILTLLIWHVLSGQTWRVRLWVLGLMTVESVVLTLPLVVLGQVMLAAEAGGADERAQIVRALGAGIYEELVFRLYLVVGLILIFERVLRTRAVTSRWLAVTISAILFALCHFSPIGRALFAWPHFVMLVLAGAYLAIVFLWRGLGVAAGCHIAFNLLSLLEGGTG